MSYSPKSMPLIRYSPIKVSALSTMETFIIVAALMASGAGTIVLLLSLANKRSQLVKAYNIQRQIEERQRQIEDNQAKMQQQASSSERNGAPALAAGD